MSALDDCVDHLDDPVDLFTILYDHMPVAPFLDGRVRYWLGEPSFWEIASAITDELRHNDALDLDRAVDAIHSERARLATILGIDTFLQGIHLAGSPSITDSIFRALLRFQATHMLNSEDLGGALLPKYSAGPGRPAGQPTLATLVQNVVRVAPDAWARVSFKRIDDWIDQPDGSDQDGLDLGAAAFLESPQDVSFERLPGHYSTNPGAEVDGYRLGPSDDQATRDRLAGRLRHVVKELDRQGHRVGVLPESSLSEWLLETWRRELRSANADRSHDGSRLLWVLAGTGPVRSAGPPVPADAPPPNRAVVLDRYGRMVFSQDKQFDFPIVAESIPEWRLERKVPDGAPQPPTAVEAISRAGVVEVRDAGVGRTKMRIAILVCEDITRHEELLPCLRAVGVSHILTPIFSTPMDGDFDFPRTPAEIYLRAAGVSVVVVNSLVVARARGRTGEVRNFASFQPPAPGRQTWTPDTEWVPSAAGQDVEGLSVRMSGPESMRP